jgi:antitoxin component YwqK of YwqJK toxin-antitoxin module
MKCYIHIAVHRLFLNLLILSALVFASACNQYYTDQNIEIKEDGLIYKVGRDDPYTGRIIDTLQNKIVEYDVVNGMKNGEFRLSSDEGIVSVYGSIEDNRNIGEWKYFYPNGQLESTGNFNYDNPHGKWVWYYYDGSIKETGTFLNGNKTGTWYRYSWEGFLLSITMYDKGEKINEIKFNTNTGV